MAAETGDELWHFELDSPVHTSPTVADGTVYIGDSSDNLYAIAAGDGRPPRPEDGTPSSVIEIPGYGVLGALTGLGAAGYLLHRRDRMNVE